MNLHVINGNVLFAVDLYKKLLEEDESRNLFMSPFSVSVALAMTYLGCRGNTASELARGLQVSDIPADVVHSTYSEVLSLLLERQYGIMLSIANKIFIDHSCTLLNTFTEDILKYYHTQVSLVNFQTNPDKSRQDINNWVLVNTSGKITDLFPNGSITNLTQLVLVNAIYFKRNWLGKFDIKNTKSNKFHINSSNTIDVQLMYQKRNFKYGVCRSLDYCQAIELPYAGGSVSMFVLLPSKIDGLKQLEAEIEMKHLNEVEQVFEMRQQLTELFLPRFKLSYEKNMEKPLKGLGINDLFSDSVADLSGVADLPGIDGTHILYVSTFMHKAVIEVNEEGSEATAATGIAVGVPTASFHLPKIICMKVDHPFLFFICSNKTKSILFLGRVVNPKL